MTDSAFFKRLKAVAREHVLREKWLVAPDLRTGWQWIERLGREGTPAVNLRVKTVRGIVRDGAEPLLAREGLAPLKQEGTALAVARALEKGLRAELGYFGGLEPSWTLYRALAASIQDLKLAGADPGGLDAKAFENPDKAADIARLWEAYERERAALRMVDYPGQIRLLLDDPAAPPGWFPPGALALIPDELELHALERELLARIPADRVIELSCPVGPDSIKPVTDLDRLQWLEASLDAPPPFGDGTVRLFRARGEVNEVREVFRRVREEKIPLDEVEAVYAGGREYASLFYETGLELFPDAEGHPVTFAEGIGAAQTAAGRALRGWVEWIAGGFPQTWMAELMRDGLIRPFGCGREEAARLARRFRPARIGAGRERYPDRLGREVESIRRRIESAPADEDGERPDWAELEALADDFGRLRDGFRELLAITPDLDASAPAALEGAVVFLETFVPPDADESEADRAGRTRLLEETRAMRESMERIYAPDGFDAWKWLLELPGQIRILGEAPKPGRLHASPLHSGGHAGRRFTFLLGLDDGRFPERGRQDPILLDHERGGISDALPTQSGRAERPVRQFLRMAARLRGSLTLGFSSFNIVEDREMFPSTAFLAAYRLVSGDAEAGRDEAMAGLGAPAVFAPGGAGRVLNETEWWLFEMERRGDAASDGVLLEQRFPRLKNGRLALEARMGNEFTHFDGWVPAAGREAAGRGVAYSASALETMGICPLRFFYQYRLRIKPPEEPLPGPDEWLDALAYGSMMHKVFEEFVLEHIEHPSIFDKDRAAERLEAILDRWIARYRDWFPPPSESVFNRRANEARRCANIFLAEEIRWRETHKPVFVEASAGLRGPAAGGAIRTEAVELENHGVKLRLRGKIDRIDAERGDPERFAVTDYKTGSAGKYKKAKTPLHQGRFLQPLVYFKIAECLLRERVGGGAKVAFFNYFFPGPRGRGERIGRGAAELTEGLNVLWALERLLSTGAFCPTNDKDDCAYCEYRALCGDVDNVTAAAGEKIRNPENTRLAPFNQARKR